MNRDRFHASILELIRRTSAVLPPDVVNVIELHRALEQQGSRADLALDLVRANIGLAKRRSAPTCRTTGTLPSYSRTPLASTSFQFKTMALEASTDPRRK